MGIVFTTLPLGSSSHQGRGQCDCRRIVSFLGHCVVMLSGLVFSVPLVPFSPVLSLNRLSEVPGLRVEQKLEVCEEIRKLRLGDTLGDGWCWWVFGCIHLYLWW